MEDFWLSQSFEFFAEMEKKGGDVQVEDYDRNFSVMKDFLDGLGKKKVESAEGILKKITEKTGIHCFDKNSLDVEALKAKMREKEEEVSKAETSMSNDLEQLSHLLDQEKEILAQRVQKAQTIQSEILAFDERSKKCLKVIETYLKFISALGVFVGKNGNKVDLRINKNSMQLEHIDGFRFKPKFEGNWMIYQNIEYIFGSELFSNFIRLLESSESN